MQLTPREQDKLLIYLAAQEARARQARGFKLNYPEAVAILSAEIVEGARDGRSAVTKRDMVNNNALPEITVDPETYDVRADGELLVCGPFAKVPMAQRYFCSSHVVRRSVRRRPATPPQVIGMRCRARNNRHRRA